MVRVRRLPPIDEASQGIRLGTHLEPMGKETASLEVLTSWFCRIANHHWLLTIQLWNVLVDHDQKVKRTVAQRHKRLMLRGMNGYGRVALNVGKQLRTKFGGGTEHLSLLPWAGILDPQAHQLLKNKSAWCPLCWREDQETGAPCYIRMLWTLEPVAVCPKHHVELATTCPRCRSSQEVLPRIPRQSICGSCGTDLISQIDLRRLRHADPHGKNVWISSALGSLIAHTCAVGSAIPPDAFCRALNVLALRHFNGSHNDLADACGMSRRMLRDWASGKAKPYLSALMEFAYRIQIPPHSMLLTEIGMTTPEDWHREASPSFSRRSKKLSGNELARLRRHLRAAIAAGAQGPRSLKAFAGTLGTTFNVLRYHFPREYKVLQARAQTRRAKDVQLAKCRRVKQIVQAATRLASNGIYPSERALKTRCDLQSSYLRRPEGNKPLTKIRRDFLARTHTAGIQRRRLKAANR